MPISCRVAKNGHKRQTPHPPLSRSPFPSRGRLTESATLNLKQTARRSSYLTFGRYACGNNIPTTRLRSAELEARGTKGCPLGTLLSPISCRVARNGHPKHNLIFFRVAKNEHKKIINQNQSIRCSPHQSADKRLPASPLEKPNGLWTPRPRSFAAHPIVSFSSEAKNSYGVFVRG